MAHNVLPLPAIPTPLNTYRESLAYRIPDAATHVCAYVATSQLQQDTPEYGWYLSLGMSEDGDSWIWSDPGVGSGDPGQIAPHEFGRAPGVWPADSGWFQLVPENAMRLCLPKTSHLFARMRIAPRIAPAGVSALYICGILQALDLATETDYPFDLSLARA